MVVRPTRRKFISAGTVGWVFLTGIGSVSAQEASLTATEALVISNQAEKRAITYQEFSALYSIKPKKQKIAQNALPDTQDIAMQALPSYGPLRIMDAIELRKKLKESKWNLKVADTLEYGAHQSGDRPQFNDAAEHAESENYKLSLKALNVRDAAANAASNGPPSEKDINEIVAALEAELKALRNNVDAIKRWSNIDIMPYPPDSTTLSIGDYTTPAAAEYIRSMANANLSVIKAARKQLPEHIEAVRTPGESFFLGVLVRAYNRNYELLGSWEKQIIGSEEINMHVQMADGSTNKYYVKTENAKIVDYAPAPTDSPTMKVFTTESTVKSILHADSPAKAREIGIAAMRSNKIRFVGVSTGAKAKSMAAEAATDDTTQSVLEGASDWIDQASKTISDTIDSLF